MFLQFGIVHVEHAVVPAVEKVKKTLDGVW